MCTSLFEIITTLVCSLGFSCIQIPTKEIIMSPPSQPNNLTLKLYLRHCRPLNDSSLIILTSPGTVAEWAFIVDSNSKPQRLNDLPKGQWKLLLPGQSSVVNNFSRDRSTRTLTLFWEPFLWRRTQFPILGVQCHHCSNEVLFRVRFFFCWGPAWLHLRQFYKMAKIAYLPATPRWICLAFILRFFLQLNF